MFKRFFNWRNERDIRIRYQGMVYDTMRLIDSFVPGNTCMDNFEERLAEFKQFIRQRSNASAAV